MMRRVARTAGQTVGREHAHEAYPVDLSRLLRASRERPHRCCAAQCEYEFSPSDVDCHATLPPEVVCMPIEGTISRFSEGTNNVLHCESLEPPMSQMGQTRPSGRVSSM